MAKKELGPDGLFFWLISRALLMFVVFVAILLLFVWH